MSGNINSLIDSINAEIVISHNAPENFFVVKENKNNSYSVWLTEPVTKMSKKLAFNFKTGKTSSLTVKKKIINDISIPDSAIVSTRESDRLNAYIKFPSLDEDIISLIKAIAIYCVEHFEPSDKFGCCGKYKECSKEKKCLHENLFYSKACWYRKNIESGKIFF